VAYLLCAQNGAFLPDFRQQHFQTVQTGEFWGEGKVYLEV